MENNTNRNMNNTNMNNTTQNAGARPPQKKKKFRFHPNKDGIMALIVLFLVVVLIITIIVCCAKAIADAVNKNDKTSGTTGGTLPGGSTTVSTTVPNGTTSSTTAPILGSWTMMDGVKKVATSEMYEGDLVLVNDANAYTFPTAMSRAITDMYKQTGHNTAYVLGNKSATATMPEYRVMLHSKIIAPLASMLSDMKSENSTLVSDKLMLSSGYRTSEYQSKLYENALAKGEEAYSQQSGFSEHHTGLAFDIKIYTAAGKTTDLREAEQNWILDNCADYGFVLRYEESKKDITKILGESWHFRYVGIVHAKYMTANNLCLEEYIELLRNSHTYGKSAGALEYAYGGDEYVIYFVKAGETAETEIPVPKNAESVEISGNNVDGFIVTVKK